MHFFRQKKNLIADTRHNGTVVARSVNSKACYSSKIEELMFQFMTTKNNRFLGHDHWVVILGIAQAVFVCLFLLFKHLFSFYC